MSFAIPDHIGGIARQALERQLREQADEAERRRALAITARGEDVAAVEKATQHDVVKVFRALKGEVYVLSQARAAKQTPGLPDLWVAWPARGVAGWFETKRPKGGRLSDEQVAFAAQCLAAGVAYGVGSRKDAEAWVIALGLAYRDAHGVLEPVR
ncbi:hypothetical protein tb265_38870 [Gemmatimonadetes bacterium T265]|nr:hypothetical protein tb265_38870 [Gemmatimonadetes bacterium T265]